MRSIDALLDEYIQVHWLANEYLDRASQLKREIGSMMTDRKYATTINDKEVVVTKDPGGSKLRIMDLLADRRVAAAKADLSTFSTSRTSVTKFREWADDHGWSSEDQDQFIAREGKEIVKIQTDPLRGEED